MHAHTRACLHTLTYGAPTLSHVHTHTHTDACSHTLRCIGARSLSGSLCVRSLITFLTRSARRAQATSFHVHVMRKCTKAIGCARPRALSLSRCFTHTHMRTHESFVCRICFAARALCSTLQMICKISIYRMEYNALWNDVNVQPGIKINTRVERESRGGRGVYRGGRDWLPPLVGDSAAISPCRWRHS